jgi:hypothetical protein
VLSQAVDTAKTGMHSQNTLNSNIAQQQIRKPLGNQNKAANKIFWKPDNVNLNP